MGNIVTLESSEDDGSNNANQQPPTDLYEDLLSTELGQKVTNAFTEVKNRIYRTIQEELTLRETTKAGAREEHQQRVHYMQEQERLQARRDSRQEESLMEAEFVQTPLGRVKARIRELAFLQEREILRFETEPQQQQEEGRRKAEETRARQEREQQHEAHEELEILRLEAEARREAEQEKERRKAEETCASLARRQENVDKLEEENRRQEKAMVHSLSIRLPPVCSRHNTWQGCPDPNCRRFHVCRLFLADICSYGITCRHVHSLTTVHNQTVCSLFNLDSERELVILQHLRRAFDENDEVSESMYLNNLERCYKFSSPGFCDQHECNRIHICRRYVIGDCERANCKFGHDLHTTHNNRVLSRHRATKMADREIIEFLREKEMRKDQKASGTGAAATSSAQNGAIPRQRANKRPNRPQGRGGDRGDGSGASGTIPAPAGLSDELQCPVCLELFSGATTLGCGHTFCAECLQEVRDRSGDRCPLCRAHISSVTRSVTLDNIVRSMTEKR